MSILPVSWKLISLGDETNLKKGKKPKLLTETLTAGLVPYVDIKAFEKGVIRKYAAPEDGVFAGKNDSLMVWDGARSGLVGNGVEGVIGSTIMRIKPTVSYGPYFHYFLASQFSYVNSNTKGTGIPHVDPAKLSEIPYPLAPLNEQIRIANKLDSILAKVDKAQARLEKIPTILKRFRQSVLAAATSGELTREWRKEREIDLASWEDSVFSEVSREITVGFVGKMADKYQGEGIPFLRSQNVRAFRFNKNKLLYISEDFHKKIYKSRLEAGNLAVVRTGAPGTTCVIPDDLGVANCSDLVIVRLDDKLISEYGCIYMNSSVAQSNVAANQVGVAQQHFNVGSMKKMPIRVPSLEEQREIIRRVEELFSMADVVFRAVESANARVERLTQSILAKAFCGELVSQDPSDESAEILLNNIAAGRHELNIPKKTAKKKPKKQKISKVVKVEAVLDVDSDLKVSSSIKTMPKSGSVEEEVFEALSEIYNGVEVELEVLLSALNRPYEDTKKALFNLIKGDLNISLKPKAKLSWDGAYKIKVIS